MSLGTRFTPAPLLITVSETAINSTDDATSKFAQGIVVQDQLGNWYKYVKNADTGNWAAGEVVKGKVASLKGDKGGTEYIQTVAGDEGKGVPIGVALNAVTTVQFGFIIVRGVVSVGNTGSPGAGDDLQLSATAKKLKKAVIATTDTTQFLRGTFLEATVDPGHAYVMGE